MVIIHMNDLLSVIVFKRFCWFIQSGENSHLAHVCGALGTRGRKSSALGACRQWVWEQRSTSLSQTKESCLCLPQRHPDLLLLICLPSERPQTLNLAEPQRVLGWGPGPGAADPGGWTRRIVCSPGRGGNWIGNWCSSKGRNRAREVNWLLQ